MFDASKTQLLCLYTLMLFDDLVMARNTTPCLGQVLTLFRTEAKTTVYVYPVQDSEAKKTYPVQRHCSVQPK